MHNPLPRVNYTAFITLICKSDNTATGGTQLASIVAKCKYHEYFICVWEYVSIMKQAQSQMQADICKDVLRLKKAD